MRVPKSNSQFQWFSDMRVIASFRTVIGLFCVVLAPAQESRYVDKSEGSQYVLRAIANWKSLRATLAPLRYTATIARSDSPKYRLDWILGGDVATGEALVLQRRSSDRALEVQRVFASGQLLTVTGGSQRWIGTIAPASIPDLDRRDPIQSYLFPIDGSPLDSSLIDRDAFQVKVVDNGFELYVSNVKDIVRHARGPRSIVGMIGWKLSFRSGGGDLDLVSIETLASAEVASRDGAHDFVANDEAIDGLPIEVLLDVIPTVVVARRDYLKFLPVRGNSVPSKVHWRTRRLEIESNVDSVDVVSSGGLDSGEFRFEAHSEFGSVGVMSSLVDGSQVAFGGRVRDEAVKALLERAEEIAPVSSKSYRNWMLIACGAIGVLILLRWNQRSHTT